MRGKSTEYNQIIANYGSSHRNYIAKWSCHSTKRKLKYRNENVFSDGWFYIDKTDHSLDWSSKKHITTYLGVVH